MVQAFRRPIALPDGSEVVTLDQARRYLLALPEARQKDADAITAIDAVLMAANGRGPVMHANVGMARAMNRPPKISSRCCRTRRRGAGVGLAEIGRAPRSYSAITTTPSPCRIAADQMILRKSANGSKMVPILGKLPWAGSTEKRMM